MPISTELFLAFVGGLIAFITPCIYPTVFSYLAFIAGSVVQSTETVERPRLRARLTPALLFVFGLAVLFTLNAFPSSIQEYLVRNYDFIVKIAGGAVLFFGLAFFGAVRIFPGQQEKQSRASEVVFGVIGVVLLGTAFGSAWTHCLGPVLAWIISVGMDADEAAKGLLLVLVYAAGLGLAFVLAGLVLGGVLTRFRWLRANHKTIKDVSGIILMVIGVTLIYTPWWVTISKTFIKLSSNSFGWRFEAILFEFFR